MNSLDLLAVALLIELMVCPASICPGPSPLLVTNCCCYDFAFWAESSFKVELPQQFATASAGRADQPTAEWSWCGTVLNNS